MKQYLIILISLLVHNGFSQPVLPDAYKEVDQLVWLVGDITHTINSWNNLGFSEIIKLDTVQGFSSKAKKSFEVIMTKANLGGAQITWIQPLKNNSIFSDFHSGFGDGVMSLVYRFDDKLIDQEETRLEALGLTLLDKIIFSTPKGDIEYMFMDTYREGKYVLGLTHSKTDLSYFQSLSNNNSHHLKLIQYAFSIKSLDEVSNFWQHLGFPPIIIEPSDQSNKFYYGDKADFEIDLAWQRYGNLPYEWVISRKPPTIQSDHIAKHGEGFHHLGYVSLVDDIIQPLEPILENYKSKGINSAMGANWGQEGKPGSGKFRMMDTDSFGGVILELLWGIRKN